MELFEGRRYKTYRGMGSMGAMQGHGADRYASGQSSTPGAAPSAPAATSSCRRASRAGCRTPAALGDVVYQLVGGLRSRHGLRRRRDARRPAHRRRFMRVTTAGRDESHPHDVTITKEAPNYQRS